MENQTTEKVKKSRKLKAALKAEETALTPEAALEGLKVGNMDGLVFPHLYQSTIELMKKQVPAIKDRDYEVRYLGIRGASNNEMDAGIKLAKLVNDACGAFRVVGRLGTCLKLDITPPEGVETPVEAVYLAYIAFSPEAAAVIDRQTKYDPYTAFFPLGGAPRAVTEELNKG